jgi:hypothetical protein
MIVQACSFQYHVLTRGTQRKAEDARNEHLSMIKYTALQVTRSRNRCPPSSRVTGSARIVHDASATALTRAH